MASGKVLAIGFSGSTALPCSVARLGVGLVEMVGRADD
jgi:hypothetical protein